MMTMMMVVVMQTEAEEHGTLNMNVNAGGETAEPQTIRLVDGMMIFGLSVVLSVQTFPSMKNESLHEVSKYRCWVIRTS